MRRLCSPSLSLLEPFSEEQQGWPAQPPACQPVLTVQTSRGPPRHAHQAPARSSAFLDVAGRAANACLLDSRAAALPSPPPSPHLQRKPMAGSLDPCVCLCLSLSVSLSLSPDSEPQRRQVPPDAPSSCTGPGLASGSTAQAAAASSASRLQSLRIFLPEQERRKDTGLGVLATLSTG